jgi:glycosyltransferase involved in cell wall biosynthesis
VNILLIGNYAPDAQESMQRYATMLSAGLTEAGHDVALLTPRRVLNRSGRPAAGIWKWIGYLDKYVLSPPQLSHHARRVDIVHVCDHANSIYVPLRSKVPYVVTCHDLLAVRAALGEQTDCATGFAGRQLQKRILSGLGRAAALACVSAATLRDAKRLVVGYPGKLVVAPNALSYPYRMLDPPIMLQRLAVVAGVGNPGEYLLHIGSNLRRKNREGVLRAIASVAGTWGGKIVFAGQPLTRELHRLAEQLGIAGRIVEVIKPSDELLEALYNGALALLFPSRFEGFGWPIIEAQACGCPVICTNREPFPEVAGDAAIFCESDDHAAFGNAIVVLANQTDRCETLRRLGLKNSLRYAKTLMVSRIESLYQQLAMVG